MCMIYKRLTNEELNKYRFPNLIAEIIESQYSHSEIAQYMGHDITTDTWELIQAKLKGEDEFLASEICGVLNLFQGGFEYLFASELYVYNSKPLAYWLWNK